MLEIECMGLSKFSSGLSKCKDVPQQLKQLLQLQLESCEKVHEGNDQIYVQQRKWPAQQPEPALRIID